MEFILEIENSDFVIEFDASFLCENFSDRENLRWNLHHGNHTPIMANVFCSTPASESRSNSLLPPVRLCGGYNEEKL